MKTSVFAIAVLALLAAPIVTHAQSSNAPMTRAEVKQQLIDLEHAGYNPSMSNDADYPRDIQAAEARVAAARSAAQTSYGSGMSGSAQSGEPPAPPTATPGK